MSTDKIFSKKLRELIEQKMITPYRVAKDTGLNKQTIINYIDGKNTPTLDNAAKIADYFGLKLSDLTGEGEMLKGGNVGNKEPDAYTTYLLPLSAMGGRLTGYEEECVTMHNCETIVSPVRDVDFAITVYGDSMAPEYPSGSRVLIKKINPEIFIDWGKVYVLDTANGIVIKEVHDSKKEGYISCHSINNDPKYAPFDLLMNDIFGMYRVLLCLSMK